MTDTESNLVRFARKELEAAGMFSSDSDYEGLLGKAVLELVQTLSVQGHSGSSHHLMMTIFNQLANFKPLSPLTSDPSEWVNQSEASGAPLWQSARDSSAFSEDGGKTFYLLEEVLYKFGCTECDVYWTSHHKPELGECTSCQGMETIVRHAQKELRHTSIGKVGP